MDTIMMDIEGIAVDYYSFTMPLRDNYGKERNTGLVNVGDAFNDIMPPMVVDMLLDRGVWEDANGRRPYPKGLKHDKSGMRVLYGGQHDNVLVEMTGKTCKYMDENGMLMSIIGATNHRAARVDLCMDLLTETTVFEIANSMRNGRIRTRSDMTSDTGNTVYLNSRKSARMCRIYRYNPPHERAHLTRIEFECKQQMAKEVSKNVLAYGVAWSTQAMLNYYDFELVPNCENHNERIRSEVIDRSASKTLVWLLKQVKPAFQKLVIEGAIQNPEEWLKNNFLDDLKDVPKQKKMFGKSLGREVSDEVKE